MISRCFTHAGTTHAVAFIRRPGGRWIAVQTVEQWATSHREATLPSVDMGSDTPWMRYAANTE